METQQILNIILCMVSFIMYFTCLIMDFFDRKNGDIIRKALYLILMLMNCSMIIRAGRGGLNDVMILWMIITVVMFVRKYLMYKGAHKRVEQKLSRLRHTIESATMLGSPEHKTSPPH